MEKIVTTKELQKIAAELAANAKAGSVFLLHGDLGVGKTTFVKAFATSMGVNEAEISSPTFNLLHVYDTQAGPKIWHYDLYRVKDFEELYELAINDATYSGITLVEWPEIALPLLMQLPVTHITLTHAHDPLSRMIKVH
jgi:tRNA threonylcarbamoyl adenosine modification protein YjeE